MGTRVSHADPVLRVRCELVDDFVVRPARWHRRNVHGSQRFEVPADLRQINISVILEKRTLVGVIVQPLLRDVSWPIEDEHAVGSLEGSEPLPRFTTCVGESGEVSQVYLKILIATDLILKSFTVHTPHLPRLELWAISQRVVTASGERTLSCHRRRRLGDHCYWRPER